MLRGKIMAGKVKIRTVSRVSFAVTLGLAALCLAISIFGVRRYAELREATTEYLICTEAVQSFRDASDYLTAQAQLAAATGDLSHIDAYFEEANVGRRRERALETLRGLPDSAEAVAALEAALTDSNALMETEFYAMRLMLESQQISSMKWQTPLKTVSLSYEDQLLSAEKKQKRAQALMGSEAYETTKEQIREKVWQCGSALSQKISSRQNRAADIFLDVYRKLILNIGIFSVMMLMTCFILYFWIVKPLLSYNESILQGTIFPVYGANELQMLAKTYNKIYRENEERAKLMRHQAEHDPLTGLLNRGSFDRLLQLYDEDGSQFALILVDVDTFKSVNDTYGHAVGDLLLKRVAALLTAAFRSVDHVCRIGGDEFAVIMVDMSSDLAYTIYDKISEVNRQLLMGGDGAPPVSLSVGAAFADRKDPGESIFKDADLVLYMVKENGRNGCRVYGEKQNILTETH